MVSILHCPRKLLLIGKNKKTVWVQLHYIPHWRVQNCSQPSTVESLCCTFFIFCPGRAQDPCPRGPGMPNVTTLSINTTSECLNRKASHPWACTQLMWELKVGAARVVRLSLPFMVLARQLTKLGNYCLRPSCLYIWRRRLKQNKIMLSTFPVKVIFKKEQIRNMEVFWICSE